MGNLLGDYGEYIALANYALTKAPGGAAGYDAVTADGAQGSDQSKPFIVHNWFSRRGGLALGVEN